MKIVVKRNEGRSLTIPFPTALACSPAGAKLVSVLSSRDGAQAISYAQARKLLKAVKAARKTLGHLPLLEVTDASGTYICIRL